MGLSSASDRQAVQRREDVLVYTSDALKDSLEVIGSVVVHLRGPAVAANVDASAHPQSHAPAGGPDADAGGRSGVVTRTVEV
jgi:predicted acyl esterase